MLSPYIIVFPKCSVVRWMADLILSGVAIVLESPDFTFSTHSLVFFNRLGAREHEVKNSRRQMIPFSTNKDNMWLPDKCPAFSTCLRNKMDACTYVRVLSLQPSMSQSKDLNPKRHDTFSMGIRNEVWWWIDFPFNASVPSIPSINRLHKTSKTSSGSLSREATCLRKRKNLSGPLHCGKHTIALILRVKGMWCLLNTL